MTDNEMQLKENEYKQRLIVAIKAVEGALNTTGYGIKDERSVVKLVEVAFLEVGRDSRTSEINEAGRTTAPVKTSPAGTGDPVPAEAQPAPKKSFGTGGSGEKTKTIKEPNAPATAPQISLLTRLVKDKLTKGQSANDYIVSFFGIQSISEVTKQMASDAIEQFSAKSSTAA